MGIGAAMTGGNPAENRQANDYYPTPPDVLEALLQSEYGPPFSFPVWEPACGDGVLVDHLIERDYEVYASDLLNYGYEGAGVADFFEFTRATAPCHTIITNPPFKLASAFIHHALFNLDVGYMALLLKSTYWQAATRHPLYKALPPSYILPLTWRPDFLKKGAPTMDVMWCVWNMSTLGPTCYEPLPRPKM